MRILVLNPGSATLKFALFEFPSSGLEDEKALSLKPLASGAIDSHSRELSLILPSGQSVHRQLDDFDISEAAQIVQSLLAVEMADECSVDTIGCRVVHGGAKYTGPALVDGRVIRDIRSFSPLAPLHNPVAADILESCAALCPGLPVVAVFDTSFHSTMPDIARTYALPYKLCEEHSLRRYGFHGIAHEDVSRKLLRLIGKETGESRCITCHLGSGASVCAIKNGQSVDTSMGMTPMEGLMMSTRSGDVDPGLLLYLLEHVGMTAGELDDLLNQRSGLLGVSGLSGDFREVEKAATAGDKRADLAIRLFAYRVAKTIGAYTVALGGVDAIAFSGGIGEHSAHVRDAVCARLSCLGVLIDAGANGLIELNDSRLISRPTSAVQVWTIRSDEESLIARICHSMLADCRIRRSADETLLLQSQDEKSSMGSGS